MSRTYLLTYDHKVINYRYSKCNFDNFRDSQWVIKGNSTEYLNFHKDILNIGSLGRLVVQVSRFDSGGEFQTFCVQGGTTDLFRHPPPFWILREIFNSRNFVSVFIPKLATQNKDARSFFTPYGVTQYITYQKFLGEHRCWQTDVSPWKT